MNAHCQNCGKPLDGGFCSQCGQSGKDYDVPVGEFAKDFASETLSLDSRLRLTLQRLVLQPGAVPKEYVAGHRARFVPPVRLYVFASFAMFLLLSVRPGVVNINASDPETPTQAVADSSGVEGPAETEPPRAEAETGSVADTVEAAPDTVESAPDTISADGTSTTWTERFVDDLIDAVRRAAEDDERFTELFMSRLPGAMFILLPAFAALLKLVHRRRLYVHHLVFSIYLHSFVFLLLALAAIPSALGLDAVAAVTDLTILWIPVYLFLGMRCFYGESRARTLVKFGVVSVAYWLLGTSTVAALFLFSLLTY